MLPPGHLAAGFLTAEAVIKLTHPVLTSVQYQKLLLWGALIGFVPDLDFFYAFVKIGSFTVPNNQVDHRKLATHFPVLWLIGGLAIYFLAATPFWKLVGLILWLASWSHFALDSLTDGVKWLWPFSQRLYGLSKAPDIFLPPQGFWSFWWNFLKVYVQTRWPIVLGELLIVGIGIFQIYKLVIK